MLRYAYLSMVLTLLTSLTQVLQAQDYKVYGNVLPPYVITDSSGFSVDVMTLLSDSAGDKFSFKDIYIAPFARVYESLKREENVAGINLAFSEERRELFQWVGPYYQVRMSLIARLNTRCAQTLISKNDCIIAVVKDTLPHQILSNMRISADRIVKLTSPVQAVHMLELKRVDMFAHIFDVTKYIMFQEKIDSSKYREFETLGESHFYFGFHNSVPKSDIEALNGKIAEIVQGDEFIVLCKQYGLENCSALQISNLEN